MKRLSVILLSTAAICAFASATSAVAQEPIMDPEGPAPFTAERHTCRGAHPAAATTMVLSPRSAQSSRCTRLRGARPTRPSPRRDAKSFETLMTLTQGRQPSAIPSNRLSGCPGAALTRSGARTRRAARSPETCRSRVPHTLDAPFQSRRRPSDAPTSSEHVPLIENIFTISRRGSSRPITDRPASRASRHRSGGGGTVDDGHPCLAGVQAVEL